MIDLEFLIPFYGAGDYLLQAIDGIRALEDTRWRVTIVEDADPDGHIIEEKVRALGDDRITYLRNDENLGVNTNIYQCIQLAEWDYCVIIDPDDLVLPHYGRAIAALLHRFPDAALMQPRAEVIDEAGRRHSPLPDRVKSLLRPSGEQPIELRGEQAAISLLRGNWLYTPATCYRRKALQQVPFREGIDAAHDLASVIDVLLDGGSLAVGDEIAYQYRRYGGSHSSSTARTGERFSQERRYFTDIAREFRDRGWHAAERAARLRLTSRLNATTRLPDAVMARDRATVTTLLKHVVGN